MKVEFESLVPDLTGLAEPPSFSNDQFRRKLINYLQSQNGPSLQDEEVVAELFRITSEYMVKDAIATKMRTPDAARDWKARGRLIKSLKRQVKESIAVLDHYLKRDMKLTTAFANPVRARYEELRSIVSKADLRHRTHSSMVSALRKMRHPGELSRDIEVYLRRRFPTKEWKKSLPVEQINLIIAGCLYAGGIYSEKEVSEDIVSRIPEQRSSAGNDYANLGRDTESFIADQSKSTKSNQVKD